MRQGCRGGEDVWRIGRTRTWDRKVANGVLCHYRRHERQRLRGMAEEMRKCGVWRQKGKGRRRKRAEWGTERWIMKLFESLTKNETRSKGNGRRNKEKGDRGRGEGKEMCK